MNAAEDIRRLLFTYCELMDAGEFEALADLFTAAVLTDEHGNVVADGRDAMLRLWRGGTHLYDGSPRTRHITANSIIDIAPDEQTATARSSYVVFQATDALALQPIITGRYRDRFGRDLDGRWTFTERCFLVDHMGDLSHHLRYEVRR
jgi:3-phenylpropionate/cinnamic acid dioxygenase small subunit